MEQLFEKSFLPVNRQFASISFTDGPTVHWYDEHGTYQSVTFPIDQVYNALEFRDQINSNPKNVCCLTGKNNMVEDQACFEFSM